MVGRCYPNDSRPAHLPRSRSKGRLSRRPGQREMTFTKGVMLPPDTPPGSLQPFARRAERLGFEELWVAEDCFLKGGIAQACAVLSVTSQLRVGLGIIPAGARNAGYAAMEIATLANLFPGRVSVGIGHGMTAWMRQVGAWPASPVTLLGEYLAAVRALLRGDTMAAHGRYVRLDAVRLDEPPAVIPDVLAGVRGPRSLALARATADGTILSEPVTPEYLRLARASGSGASPHRIVAYNVAAVDDDRATAVETARPALERIGEPDWAAHLVPLPFGPELAALRRDCRSTREFAMRLPGSWIEQLALAGTPDTVSARMRELAGEGADTVVLIPVGLDPVGALDSLARVL
jgi:5,10-methylenetetrahydromethanopterin reductase